MFVLTSMEESSPFVAECATGDTVILLVKGRASMSLSTAFVVVGSSVGQLSRTKPSAIKWLWLTSGV